MKSSRILCVILFMLGMDAPAVARESASYSISAEAFDSGGGVSSSTSYRNLGAAGLIGGFSSSASYTAESGYPAQIDGSLSTVPVASFTANPNPAARNQIINFDGRSSYSPDPLASIVSYQWNWGDGSPVGSGDTANHAYSQFGIYTATLTVTDGFGESASTIRSIHVTIGNTSPIFAGYSVSTPYQTEASISLGKLLSKASDADGDALSVTVAGPASAQGGTAVLQSGSILYTPPAGYSGTDSFTVTISDLAGATVSGAVTVTVQSNGGVGANAPLLTMLPGGHVGIAFQGIPGRNYQIQRSTDLNDWQPLTIVTAAANGEVTFTDESPPGGSAFYRLRKP